MKDRLLLLGIPVDRIPREHLEETLLRLIESYDHSPKFATTISALFLGKLSGFTLTKRLMPQVIATLRKADFIGVESKELIVLSKLLGNTIESTVRPVDLLLAAASLLSKYQKSLFLLGGNEDSCQATESMLKIDFPSLKIVGAKAPGIFTKGLELIESVDTDDAIIEMINHANPTILALHLGHPKQEIWFERIRTKIKVPLIVGVGGAFNHYLRERGGNVQKAPSRFLEKMKQKTISFFHYCCWVPPLLIFNSFNHLVYTFLYKGYKKASREPHLFLSKKEALFMVPLPTFVNRKSWEKTLQIMEVALEYENVIIDFRPVKHINPSGLGLLHRLCKTMHQQNKNLFLMGMSGDIKTLLKLNGAWDLVESSVVFGPDDVLHRLSINRNDNLLQTRVFLSINQVKDTTIISFFGRIHSRDVEEQSGFQLEPMMSGHHLIIDLDYCTAICNLGFSFLLQLREYQKREKLSLVIQNASPFIRQQFKYYQLEKYFTFL